LLCEGVVEFAGGAVDASTRRAQFLAMHPDATVVIENPPFRTYRLGPVAVRGRVFYANVMFVDDSLGSIGMSPENAAKSWDDITDALLAADKAGNDRWLKTEFALGPAATLAWGTIHSSTDIRSGSSSITITFDGAARARS
jgi:hypothetical protein